MGALNAVEITAATPQPTPTVAIHRLSRPKRATREPSVAPRCASGPYWPTDAPAPSDTMLATEDRKPVRTGIRPSNVWTDWMISAGPCERPPGTAKWMSPTISPPAAGTQTVATSSSRSLSTIKRLRGEISNHSFRTATSSTKPTAASDAKVPDAIPRATIRAIREAVFNPVRMAGHDRSIGMSSCAHAGGDNSSGLEGRKSERQFRGRHVR